MSKRKSNKKVKQMICDSLALTFGGGYKFRFDGGVLQCMRLADPYAVWLVVRCGTVSLIANQMRRPNSATLNAMAAEPTDDVYESADDLFEDVI